MLHSHSPYTLTFAVQTTQTFHSHEHAHTHEQTRRSHRHVRLPLISLLISPETRLPHLNLLRKKSAPLTSHLTPTPQQQTSHINTIQSAQSLQHQPLHTP
ncbi:hypothetical protein M501DRAFT_1003098 [Patellaria atrata CBS 101060]|uniref:Uncharacterized protein n=1 Tax=Patellaria atrata CBS 101060 TaxID=1346257 RepID=A0A9P4VRR4_9PEZI|nr:hypothetical protein M501DRAFT_1003098 [Patellaria atrata CBS 101060]